MTDAYELDAEYVVHAAAMPHSGDGLAMTESARDATRNALETADELGATSLALPALGCGVAGFALREGARIIGEKILRFDPESLADVRFIAYGEGEFETIRTVSNSL
ncbi:hypothetical protein GCM10009000_052230 [Halobacterium noricense]|uniref:Macro domain-containing protein n=1 Tax=Haladaptatus pallidirubidus TaxID=1008152 RepID=A0AAV3UCW9_9EURY